MTHFYKGDKLKAVNVLDDDGEPCEGRLIMGEIVTMDDRSSECRPFIIVTRENGRQLQIEKTRFELHCRAGGVVLGNNLCPEIVDTSSEPMPQHIWDLITQPVNPPQEVLDYMTGKISFEESMHITDQRAMEGPDWNPTIDGAGMQLFKQGKLSLEDYTKIRNRKENGLTDEECVAMFSKGENK